MANGNMAEQIRAILENGEDIPQSVTNKLILMTLIQSHQTTSESFKSVDRRIDDVESQIILNSNEIGLVKDEVGTLKESQSVFRAQTETKQENAVTLGYLWDKFGLPVIMLLISIAISAIVAINISQVYK